MTRTRFIALVLIGAALLSPFACYAGKSIALMFSGPPPPKSDAERRWIGPHIFEGKGPRAAAIFFSGDDDPYPAFFECPLGASGQLHFYVTQLRHEWPLGIGRLTITGAGDFSGEVILKGKNNLRLLRLHRPREVISALGKGYHVVVTTKNGLERTISLSGIAQYLDDFNSICGF